MFHEMAKYAVKENTQVVWDCLINSVNRIYPSDGRDEHESGHDLICDRLSLLVQLTDVWTKWKAGELILHPVQLYEVFQ